MRTGTVKFFNSTKWYGFIKDNEDGTEVFVHISGIKRDDDDNEVILQENDTVEFEVEETKKGLSAINVRKIEKMEEMKMAA